MSSIYEHCNIYSYYLNYRIREFQKHTNSKDIFIKMKSF